MNCLLSILNVDEREDLDEIFDLICALVGWYGRKD